MSLVFVSVFREAYDRTKPTEEGRASALRGRLQSVDPTKLNNALAPRAAGRAEASLRALLLVLWRATRTGRERSCALCTRFAPAEGCGVGLGSGLGGVRVRAWTSRRWRAPPPPAPAWRDHVIGNSS